MSANPYTPDAQAALTRAAQIASDRGHGFITLEHLLTALLDEALVREALIDAGADPLEIAHDCNAFLEDPANTGGSAGPGGRELYATPALNRVLNRARALASGYRRPAAATDLTAAILDEEDCHAAYFLKKQGITREILVGGPAGEPQPAAAGPQGRSGPAPKASEYLVDLNARAEKGEIDPVIGRTDEIRRVCQILIRRRKNNPVLVGEPGVGKTAIAEGLARAIVRKEAPEPLHAARVFLVDVAAMLAGAKFRGDFEERLKAAVAQLEKTPGAIGFIDEIHTLVGTGAGGGSAMDAANILKPALQGGKLRIMGATTYKEWRQHIEKDGALARRFQKVDVAEPTPADAKAILLGVKAAYEQHHGVKVADEAIEAAVDLSVRHLQDRRLPDKAIDLLDEAGAAWRLADPATRPAEIGRALVAETVARIARLPKTPETADESARLEGLADALKAEIFGQDQAIDALANAVIVARAGLRDPEKPVGSFLFQGPTGVGKTEVARALAKRLGLALHRFDMSEYMEKHSVARLIGAPPGYVGHDQGGLLTEAVSRQPNSVVLIDEVEKAHEDIQSVLLQVLDAGRLTDGTGKTTDFRQAIVILTTNTGTREATQRPIGFLAPEGGDADRGREAVEKRFPPELRNRLDAIISFAPLGPAEMVRVVDKEIARLETMLRQKGVRIAVSPEARALLARLGHEPAYGARPLARVIQKKIKEPLARQILFGDLKGGGTARVEADGEEIRITAKAKAQRKAPVPAEA
jgi:ATP-dependent Clp protease ATP-binding subunit ClpA